MLLRRLAAARGAPDLGAAGAAAARSPRPAAVVVVVAAAAAATSTAAARRLSSSATPSSPAAGGAGGTPPSARQRIVSPPLTAELVRASYGESAPKRTTGLVGLAVDPHARERLVELYAETLEEVASLTNAELRELVTRVTKYRESVVRNPKLAVAEIELEIDAGQIEQLVEQAQDELEMVRRLAQAGM